MRIAVASDHAGFGLKRRVAEHLQSCGHEVSDLGPPSPERVDYPDFAARVARGLGEGAFERGVLVCGSGIGMSMTANRFEGVRAIVAAMEVQARLSRAHNDANVLCLGERITAPELALAILDVFLNTPFEGGRHRARVDKIDAWPPKAAARGATEAAAGSK